MVAERIKLLRSKRNMTQTELAKCLGITRSSVNAWEMGISVPSTQYVVQLANLFQVSADFLLGINDSATISISGLTEEDSSLVAQLIEHLRNKNIRNS